MATSVCDRLERAVQCRLSRRIEVEADAAWAVIGELGSRVPVEGLVEKVEVAGEGAGALRTYHFPGGARVVERIEAYEPELRRYLYRILDYGPLAMARYMGLAEVSPAGPGACILTWCAFADPLDGDVESLSERLEGSIGAAVEAFRLHLERAAGL
ncbi:MAG: SRPBCC family protein [Allosphingosinicella sp.]|uniref:SRPBCC family protein n=1 Tax=Allosphingosinicella sp. TaxID=2823234 RepID=UPI003922247C